MPWDGIDRRSRVVPFLGADRRHTMTDTTRDSDDAINVPLAALRTAKTLSKALWPLLLAAGSVLGAVFTWGVMSATSSMEYADVKKSVERHGEAIEKVRTEASANDRELREFKAELKAFREAQTNQGKQLDRIIDRLDRDDRKGRAMGVAPGVVPPS